MRRRKPNLIGEKVNHKFNPSKQDNKICSEIIHGTVCARSLMAHTRLATCELCSGLGEIELYASHPNQAICHTCKEAQVNKLIEHAKQGDPERKEINGLVKEIETRDLSSIKFSGDIFNTRLMTFTEMFEKIKADDSITDKEMFYQRMVANRIRELNIKREIQREDLRSTEIELLAGAHAIREYGGQIRDEIRKQIKESDSTYQPIINEEAIKKSLKSKAVKSPFERAAEAMAISKGITVEEARQIILKGLKS